MNTTTTVTAPAVDSAWHGAAFALITGVTLALALLAGRVAGHETVAVGTVADRIYLTDGFYPPERTGASGVYRWTEPLAQLRLPNWGPGPLRVRVSGIAAGSETNDITLLLDGQIIGHTTAAPGGRWTVEGTGETGARDPVVTLEGPRLAVDDPRLLGRIVTGLEITAPAARDRAWLHLGLLALAGLALYAALLRWTGRRGALWALALMAGAALPAVFGPLAVYRDRWTDAIAWTALPALGALLLLDSRFRPTLRARWRTAAALLALTAALLLLALGMMNAFDADRMYQVAAGLAEYGIPSRYPGRASFTKYGLGQPLLAVPFYLLGKAALVFGGDRELLTRFAVSLTNLPITALLCWLLYRAGRRFVAPPVALAIAATYLLTTLALNYARTFFSEPAGALLLLGAVLLLVPRQGEEAPGTKRILLAGLCLGAMVLIKPAFAVYIPAPGLVALGLAILAGRQARLQPPALLRRVALTGAAFAAGPLAAVLLQLGYNLWRYALLLHNGYEREAGFSTPLLEGLVGLLLSPGKSLFLYAPVLLLAPLGCWLLWRGGGRPGQVAALLVVAEAASGIGLNATWWAWTGNFAWGPRLILPVVPLLLWPVAAIIDGPTRILMPAWRRLAAGTWVVLGLLGALVSIPGALVDFQVYYGLRGLELAGQEGEAATIYDPAQSPLLVEPGYLLDGLTAAIHRPTLADAGLPPLWDTAVPSALTALALLAAWLAASGRRTMDDE